MGVAIITRFSFVSVAVGLMLCLADFNCDIVVDMFDYLDFVSAFAENAATADFNNDSVVDLFDYLDFVNAFSAGC